MQITLPERKETEQYVDESPSSLDQAVLDRFYNRRSEVQEKVLATQRIALENPSIYINNRDILDTPSFTKVQEHKGIYTVEKYPTSIANSDRDNYDITLLDGKAKIPITQEDNTDLLLFADSGWYEGTTYVRDENSNLSQADTERSICLDNLGVLVSREYRQDMSHLSERVKQQKEQNRKRGNAVGGTTGATAFGIGMTVTDVLTAAPIGALIGYLAGKAITPKNEQEFDISNTHPTLFGNIAKSNYEDLQYRP